MIEVNTEHVINKDKSLKIVCIVRLPPTLEKTYSVTFSKGVREKYNDSFLIDDHTKWSKQDFCGLLSRLNSKQKIPQINSEFEK